jgi:intracellular septation protein
MKLLYDYFPIICFFIAYKLYGIYIATAVTMVAAALQVTVLWLVKKRFEKLHVITLALILVLGGTTLLFHKAIYIQLKPSVIYWLFSLFLIGSQYIGQKPLIRRMLDMHIQLPERIWKQLNLAWSLFFLFMGFLNLYVVYHYSTNAWVNFKLFGTLGLLILFAIAQALYLSRYIDEDQKKKH